VIHYPDSLLADPPTRGFAQALLRDSATPFLARRAVVPGALLLRVIVMTMFSTPLAESESLCVVFIVIIGTSPCHERIAPNGTSGKAETAAPGRPRKPFCTAIVWFHCLGIRSIRSQLGLAIPMIGHRIGAPSRGMAQRGRVVTPAKRRRDNDPRSTADTTSNFYFVPSSAPKSACTFVRQLRGPDFSTCA
jgi:hypothetical protein